MSHPGVFLSNVYSSASQKLHLEMINAYHQPSHSNIDSMVDIEMKRLRSAYSAEEDLYVQQMLAENPIVVERRNNANQTPELCHERETTQRSESCRKSRINNKIKKAKTKYRHQYISQKVAQSSQMLSYIQNVISQAECQLLKSGLNPMVLERLRATYGITDLDHKQDDASSTSDSMSMQKTFLDKEF